MDPPQSSAREVIGRAAPLPLVRLPRAPSTRSKGATQAAHGQEPFAPATARTKPPVAAQQMWPAAMRLEGEAVRRPPGRGGLQAPRAGWPMYFGMKSEQADSVRLPRPSSDNHRARLKGDRKSVV